MKHDVQHVHSHECVLRIMYALNEQLSRNRCCFEIYYELLKYLEENVLTGQVLVLCYK